MKNLITIILLSMATSAICVAQKPKKVSYIIVKYYDRKTKTLRFADTIRSSKRF